MRLLIIPVIFLLATCISPVSDTDQTDAIEEDSLTKKQVAVTRLKFVPKVTFNDFKVDTFKGKRAAINYSSNKTAKHFKTVISQAYIDETISFGGHFKLVRWGCGTSCIFGAVVDLKDGIVYDLPIATVDYSYRPNSRLLIVNPTDSSGYYEDCGYCEPEFWIWNDKKKKFVRHLE